MSILNLINSPCNVQVFCLALLFDCVVMGVRLIILLALLVGVLYSLHLLVQDYQALTAAPKLLRLLFKRDLGAQERTMRGTVRWRRILMHDPIQCARYLYCNLGARPPNNSVLWGFVYMLTLKPHEEDVTSLEYFQRAYNEGQLGGSIICKENYLLCPFEEQLLYRLIQYLIDKH